MAFDRIDQYITALNIQPQFGDVDNPVFCNCTGAQWFDMCQFDKSKERSQKVSKTKNFAKLF